MAAAPASTQCTARPTNLEDAMARVRPDPQPPAASPHLTQVIAQVLSDAHQRGYPPPRAVRIDAGAFSQYGRRSPHVAAQADYYNEEIYVNPESWHFKKRKSIRKYARRFHAKGYTSTDDPAHVLRHELAHLLHARAAGVGFLDDHQAWPRADAAARAIAARVSHRATQSPSEFVAEVFAGMWGGRDFDADGEVMAWYHRYRGPALAPVPGVSAPVASPGDPGALANHSG